MLKTLIKKQILELFAMLFIGSSNKKKKNNKSKKSAARPGLIALFVILYIVVMLCIGLTAIPMAIFILPSANPWLYYGIFAVAGMFISFIINIFIASTMIFNAKDNDLLLSLPIPIRKIIISRMTILYINCFVCLIMLWLPACIVALFFAQISFSLIFCWFLFILIGPFFTLIFACIFGWLIALITRNKNTKTLLTIIFSVLLVLIAIFSRFIINDAIKSMLGNIDAIAEIVRQNFYLLYFIGLASSGSIFGMLIFAIITIVLFSITCWIITKSFLNIATTSKGTKKRDGRYKVNKSRSITKALFFKEFNLLFKTPVYLINCAIGIIFVGVILVMIITQSRMFEAFRMMAQAIPNFGNFYPGVILAIGCLALGFNCISTPSISLEGKTIWILKSLPIRVYDIFKAKALLHIFVNLIPSFIFIIVFSLLLGVSLPDFIAMLLFSIVFNSITAYFGVLISVKRANLSWTNIAMPVKQNLGILFSILFTLGISIVCAIIYIAICFIVPAWIILIGLSLIMLFFIWLIIKWLKNSGVKLFNEL